MLDANSPALVLAPMDGITDAPMRAFQGATGAFSYGVTEFIRVSIQALPAKVFRRHVPELQFGGSTPTGMPVQVQLLGGNPELMARSALTAVKAGATAIDINFGCPAPTVNRNDGGASLLRFPCRIRDVVRAVRTAVPPEVPVSAKLRLGWDSVDPVHENAAMAAEGGANWLTIHARTRVQGYNPPVFWEPIRQVRERLGIPVVANGDIWTVEDLDQCIAETGCRHFMLGRSALADPQFPARAAHRLGIREAPLEVTTDWPDLLASLVEWTSFYEGEVPKWMVKRLKQWLNLAYKHGEFESFATLKWVDDLDELFHKLRAA